jgi:hypothetical protein
LGIIKKARREGEERRGSQQDDYVPQRESLERNKTAPSSPVQLKIENKGRRRKSH